MRPEIITCQESKIEDIYAENKYTLFVNYCRNNGIEYMSDLEGFDFNELYSVRGIGEGKIKAVASKYEKYIRNKSEAISISKPQKNTTVETMFACIHPQLMNINIDFLSSLGITSKPISNLIVNGYTKIGDIAGISVKILQNITGKWNFNKFKTIEDELKKPLFEIFEDVLSEPSQAKYSCIYIKRAHGCTLQKIGNKYRLSREGVRQIVIEFNAHLDPFMKIITNLLMCPKNYMTVQELSDIYDNDDYGKIMAYWCKNNEEFEYLEFAETFVYAGKEKHAVEKQIRTIVENFISDNAKSYENFNELEDSMQNNGFPYMDKTAIINLLQEYGYEVYGNFITKGVKSYGYLCARIVAKKFPDGIRMHNNNDLNKLRAYTAEEYGSLKLPKNNRSFSMSLAEHLVLSGRGIATAKQNVHIEMPVLDEIRDYIDNSQKSRIGYSEIFSVFKEKLRMCSNIDNYNFLHGVLKLYFSDKYYFPSRDYLKKKI